MLTIAACALAIVGAVSLASISLRRAQRRSDLLAMARATGTIRHWCGVCDMRIEDPSVHFALAHRARATGPEDSDRWSA